jgi:hypothetical protein
MLKDCMDPGLRRDDDMDGYGKKCRSH